MSEEKSTSVEFKEYGNGGVVVLYTWEEEEEECCGGRDRYADTRQSVTYAYASMAAAAKDASDFLVGKGDWA